LNCTDELRIDGNDDSWIPEAMMSGLFESGYPFERQGRAMRPDTRRLLWGLLGFASSLAGIGLLGWLAGDWPLTDAPVRAVLMMIVVVVLGTVALVSMAYACSGLVRLMFGEKSRSA
jgi:hypothetical protein